MLVARLLELEVAGALTTGHVCAGAQVGGVNVRTVWRWLDAARTEGRVERRPRARLELSDQRWEALPASSPTTPTHSTPQPRALPAPPGKKSRTTAPSPTATPPPPAPASLPSTAASEDSTSRSSALAAAEAPFSTRSPRPNTSVGTCGRLVADRSLVPYAVSASVGVNSRVLVFSAYARVESCRCLRFLHTGLDVPDTCLLACLPWPVAAPAAVPASEGASRRRVRESSRTVTALRSGLRRSWCSAVLGRRSWWWLPWVAVVLVCLGPWGASRVLGAAWGCWGCGVGPQALCFLPVFVFGRGDARRG